MRLRRTRTALGVDLGAACLKSVVLSLREGRLELVRCDSLPLRKEGILSEADLYAVVTDWLRRTGNTGLVSAAALPQHLATTQVIDFPANAGPARLAEMVAFETRQLAGLSDEPFVHGCRVLAPGFGRRNPVLIGICRESVVRERLAGLEQAGLAAPSLVMSGIAAVNCLLSLYPEAAAGGEPALLLDIGWESSTVVVLAGRQPLFVTSLLFGSQRFVEAVAERGRLEGGAAEAELQRRDLAQESPRSPLSQSVRKLLAEIQDAVDHWRAQERPELNTRPLAGGWLCGGAARIAGLPAVLAEELGCPVSVFGPPGPDGRGPMPELAVAHGLAQQALGAAAVPVDLTPPDVRERAHRERRFPLLAAACVLLVLLAGCALLRAYLADRAALRRIAAETAELDACERLVSRLEEANRTIERCEAGLVPLVQCGNRGRRFVEAIDALGTVCGPRDWFVYLGDEESYRRAETPPPGAAPSPGQPPAPFTTGRPEPAAAPGAVAEFPVRLNAVEAAGSATLLAAGCTPHEEPQTWASVRDMIDRLRGLGPYGRVDMMMGHVPDVMQRAGRQDIFAPWRPSLEQRYDAFALWLTLAEPDAAPRGPTQAGRAP